VLGGGGGAARHIGHPGRGNQIRTVVEHADSASGCDAVERVRHNGPQGGQLKLGLTGVDSNRGHGKHHRNACLSDIHRMSPVS